MDVRVANGLKRFVEGEIELFGLPLKNTGSGQPCTPLDPGDSYSFCSFCVYLAVNSFNIAVNAYGDAVTEGYSERGFDGIAISIDDIPLDCPETAETVTRDTLNLYRDALNNDAPAMLPAVRILMVQVKMTGNARTTELDSLGGSAYRFLTREKYLIEMEPNEMVARWWKIYDAIRRVYCEFNIPFAPELDLLFIYQGYKPKEENLNSNACITQRDILSEKLKQDKVNFSTWRVDEIIDAIGLADQAVDGTLAKAKLLPLPDAKAFGYIGYVPARSIADMIPRIKILGDKKDRPDERVFADNVRSFTGDHKNPGAVALRKTLLDGEGDQVILRHNGITIVARDATLSGDPDQGEVDVNLKAYQIVNGAQSSFVLQRHCERLDDAYIPIKIVVTEDEEVKNGVVLGANLQSQ
ncbi:MAG: AIPR family protein, partial [Verrucomicrobiales bacterium]|nr:AIPR family protein [Verrucomicrobiales bacterium]